MHQHLHELNYQWQLCNASLRTLKFCKLPNTACEASKLLDMLCRDCKHLERFSIEQADLSALQERWHIQSQKVHFKLKSLSLSAFKELDKCEEVEAILDCSSLTERALHNCPGQEQFVEKLRSKYADNWLKLESFTLASDAPKLSNTTRERDNVAAPMAASPRLKYLHLSGPNF